MKITAYECNECGAIFKSEALAKNCEKECTETKESDANSQAKRDYINERLNYPRLNAQSIPHLIKLTKEVILELYGIELSFHLDVSWRDSVSITHCAPIGKETNWGSKPGKPTGYPGFYGRIRGTSKAVKKMKIEGLSFCKTHNTELSGSDFFSGSFGNGVKGINTGSGSGGSPFGYDVSLFIDDFPLIKKNMARVAKERAKMNEKLRDIEAKKVEEIQADSKVLRYSEIMAGIHAKIVDLRNEANMVQSESTSYQNETYIKPANIKSAAVREKFAKWLRDNNLEESTWAF